MTNKQKLPLLRILKFIGFPIRFLASVLHCRFLPTSWKKRKIRKKTEIVIGSCLMVGASAAAVSYPYGCVIPHAVYDALAYLVHGIGSAPIVAAILNDINSPD